VSKKADRTITFTRGGKDVIIESPVVPKVQVHEEVPNSNPAVTTIRVRTPVGYEPAVCKACGGPTEVEEIGQLAPHKPYFCIMGYAPMYKCLDDGCGLLTHVPREAYIFADDGEI
jgi:hypothetical protein